MANKHPGLIRGLLVCIFLVAPVLWAAFAVTP